MGFGGVRASSSPRNLSQLWDQKHARHAGSLSDNVAGRRLALFGNAFNVLDARGFEGQGFMDPVANPDIVPAPLRGFSFLAGAEASL